MLKVVVLNNEPVVKKPEVAFNPDHPPVPPIAEQEVALVDDQLTTLESP